MQIAQCPVPGPGVATDLKRVLVEGTRTLGVDRSIPRALEEASLSKEDVLIWDLCAAD